MDPFATFVNDFVRSMDIAKKAQLGGYAPCARPQLPPNARKALIFSPHPDDECIVGGVALRLLREAKMNVINVAVTQGSNKARQAARLAELQGACNYLGFGLIQVCEGGLEKINPKGRASAPDNWAAAVRTITAILRREKPSVVLFPHEADWNTTHMGVHDLVFDALGTLGTELDCYVVENEFWAPLANPNLMVEISAADLIDLITATSFHVGEVERNPYHLGLPAWMRDNVRRGGELVGGQGGAVPEFPFAALYRLRKWQGGAIQSGLDAGRILNDKGKVAALFPA